VRAASRQQREREREREKASERAPARARARELARWRQDIWSKTHAYTSRILFVPSHTHTLHYLPSTNITHTQMRTHTRTHRHGSTHTHHQRNDNVILLKPPLSTHTQTHHFQRIHTCAPLRQRAPLSGSVRACFRLSVSSSSPLPPLISHSPSKP
jgi:hypothetical protein